MFLISYLSAVAATFTTAWFNADLPVWAFPAVSWGSIFILTVLAYALQSRNDLSSTGLTINSFAFMSMLAGVLILILGLGDATSLASLNIKEAVMPVGESLVGAGLAIACSNVLNLLDNEEEVVGVGTGGGGVTGHFDAEEFGRQLQLAVSKIDFSGVSAEVGKLITELSAANTEARAIAPNLRNTNDQLQAFAALTALVTQFVASTTGGNNE